MSDVTTLIAAVLKVQPAQLSDDDGMETMPQWDSLKTVLIASMVEVAYGITLTGEDIEQLTSVRAVREIVARHGQG